VIEPRLVAGRITCGGLVIGTPDLLELCLRVQRGDLDRQAARDWLWQATGYLALPE
jgi:hypothetical protein